MARKKKIEETLTDTEGWPKITKGSHTTITEHRDGKVEMTWDWEQLNKDINDAIREFNLSKSSQAVVSEKSKKTRAKSNGKKGSKNELV